MKVNWKGVFPAITTQFRQDESLDIEGTARHLETMIQAGIHGVVLLGTVGENTALEYQEKLTVIRKDLLEMKKRMKHFVPGPAVEKAENAAPAQGTQPSSISKN